MLRALFAAIALPIAPLAAAVGTDDLRLGIAFGIGTDSEFEVSNAGVSEKRDVDGDEPLRVSAGYVHRFAAADASGAIAGIEAFYQRGPGGLDGTISAIDYDLDATAFGFDLLAGYSLALPSRLRVEGFAFGGYFIQQLQLRSDFQDVPFTGDGWEAGIGVGGFYALDAQWDLGLQARYLLLCESSVEYGTGEATLDLEGLLVGLTLALRL